MTTRKPDASPPAGAQDCLHCVWRKEGYFCELASDGVRGFEELSFRTRYPENAILFGEGEPPRGAYLLCHGTVKLSSASRSGKILVTRLVRPGELIGLSSALTGHPYKSTAETTAPCEVALVRRTELVRFIGEHPDACKNAALQLAGECEEDLDQLRTLGLSHSAAERLASLILEWCATHGTPGPRGIRVPMLMRHEDVAHLIGTARETVTRLLKSFRQRGILTTRGATMTVLDRAALESIALS